MENKKVLESEYYFKYIIDILSSTPIYFKNKNKQDVIVSMIKDLQFIIIEYLENVIDIENEAKLFTEYIKSISTFILSVGNIALMLIAVIAWFTFNGIDSIDKDNQLEHMEDNLKLIKLRYIKSFTKVNNATVAEVMHSYSYTLEKILIHKDFGYGSYKDLYIPILLNRTISFRKENK